MREWVDGTVERIAALAPRRLLEIGCGTGLLVSRLAPLCDDCWATDFSAEALARAGRALAGAGASATLLQQAAAEVSALPAGRFDTVVLNSIVQYFPDLTYLRRVLAGIRRVAAPGARIFLGDLRSLPLLAAFHASVLLRQADGATPLAELRAELALRVSRERELLLAPAFFAAFGAAEPDVAGVEVQLKRGRARNELTRFRYDVVLTLAGGEPPSGRAGGVAAAERRLDWRAEGLTPAALRRRLDESGHPPAVTVAGVPNARLVAEIRALALLEQEASGLETLADLQEAARRDGADGVEPEEIWALGRDLPYRVEVGWGSAGLDTFDAVLRAQEAV
jgi:SAM-dependent methyltransferase